MAIERHLLGLMSYKAVLKQHGKQLRVKNVMERVNREIKRRSRVVSVFPNVESLLRGSDPS
jgi:transposase-like protein